MAARELEEGLKAPAFAVEAADGSKVKIGDLAGYWVVLFFYVQASGHECAKEAVGFQQAMGKFTRLGAAILGVSRESATVGATFAARCGLTFPLLRDPGRTLHDEYGVMKVKRMYGRMIMGVERSTFLIDPEGRIRKIWRDVKVPGHVDAVLRALKAARRKGEAK